MKKDIYSVSENVYAGENGMKKAIYIIVALLLSAAVCLGVFVLRADRVRIEGEAEVCFRYGKNDVRQRLEGADRDELATILDSKRLYRGDPSCGFDEDVSVRFGAQTFCIARDTCPFLYCKEEDRYPKLSETEKSRLYELPEPYGVFFPCV